MLNSERRTLEGPVVKDGGSDMGKLDTWEPLNPQNLYRLKIACLRW